MARSRLGKLTEALAQGTSFEKAPDPDTVAQPDAVAVQDAPPAATEEPGIASEMLADVLGEPGMAGDMPSEEAPPTLAVQPLRPPAPGEPAGMLPGDLVWLWTASGGRLTCEAAVLRDQDRKGRWNLVVFRTRAPGIVVAQRSMIPYSAVPQHNCWTLRDPKVFYPEA